MIVALMMLRPRIRHGLPMIPMSAKTHVTEANQVIVTIASIGRKCARPWAFPAVPKVTERTGVRMTLVTLVQREPIISAAYSESAFPIGATQIPMRILWAIQDLLGHASISTTAI